MQPPPIGRALCRRSPSATCTPSAIMFSDTSADIVEEALGCLFDQLEYTLETVWSAVVRVGDLAFGRVGREVEEQADHGVFPAEGRHHPVVLLVHRQDVVEPVAVFGVEEAGPLGRDVYSAGEHALLRSRVRRLPGVVEAVGARRVYRYLVR